MRTIAEKLGLADRDEPPEIDERCDFWLDVFSTLSPSRPNSPGPIPLSEMNALLQMVPMPCQPKELVSVIQAMDVVFLDHIRKGKGK